MSPTMDDWAVTDIRGSHKMGWYYTLNIAGSDRNTTLTVKLSRHGTHVCMSCNKADACPHARFVSRYIDRHGIPEEK